MLALLSQVNLALPQTIPGILILVIVIAAIIAITYIALKAFGMTIPPWAVQIFWIVVIACVAILAIRVVLGM